VNSSLFHGHAGCLQLRVSKETWEPEFSLGQLYNKGLFLLGYAPEVIDFTTRLLENQDQTVEHSKMHSNYCAFTKLIFRPIKLFIEFQNSLASAPSPKSLGLRPAVAGSVGCFSRRSEPDRR
jgi:hypothetical protein